VLDPAVFHRRRNRVLGELAELAGPVLRAAGRMAARRAPTAPASWRRGLIIGHTHMGDVLYRTASLGPLRELLPQCAWSYLCAPGTAELLETQPAVAEVLPLARGESSWSLAPGGFAELRRRDFDVALCTNTLRPYADFALATALGIPNRVGFSHKGLSGLLTLPLAIDFPSPFPAYFRAMVAAVGNAPGAWELRPRLVLTEADRAAADRCWNELALDGTPVVACVLTTRQPHGNWPAAHLVEALRLARAERRFAVVLCGGAGDGEYLEQVAGTLGQPVHVVAGRLGLRALAAFLERCTALLTLDTGPRHLANAVGTPVIFARNLLHSRIEAGAYCPGEIDVAPPLEHLDDAGVAAAAARTPPGNVAAALRNVLAGAHGRERGG
jgi:heptosyltransferase-2